MYNLLKTKASQPLGGTRKQFLWAPLIRFSAKSATLMTITTEVKSS